MCHVASKAKMYISDLCHNEEQNTRQFSNHWYYNKEIINSEVFAEYELIQFLIYIDINNCFHVQLRRSTSITG